MGSHRITTTDHVLYRLISAELRAARQARRMQQIHLAQLAGMPTHTVLRIEKGYSRPSVVDFAKMCAVMDLQPGEVLDRLIGVINDSNVPEGWKIDRHQVGEEEPNDQ